MKLKKKSRHIPVKIKKSVEKKHYFECAWCGTHITEKHHIVPFSECGNHEIDNLILLCSNCHTQAHQGKVSSTELLSRKSTHIKGDRISGGVQFDLPEAKVILGNCTYINCQTLVQFEENPIIEIQKKNDSFFLSSRFYDNKGDLICWISDNRFWCPSDFRIESSKGLLTIKKGGGELILRIFQENDYLKIEGKCWYKGKIFRFSSNSGNSLLGEGLSLCFHGNTMKNCRYGIKID